MAEHCLSIFCKFAPHCTILQIVTVIRAPKVKIVSAQLPLSSATIGTRKYRLAKMVWENLVNIVWVQLSHNVCGKIVWVWLTKNVHLVKIVWVGGSGWKRFTDWQKLSECIWWMAAALNELWLQMPPSLHGTGSAVWTLNIDFHLHCHLDHKQRWH